MAAKALLKFKEAILEDLEKTRIAIVMHDNPDPDCIGASWGLTKLLQTWNPESKCTLLYSGEVSHSQNKTLVNVLNIPLVNINEFEKIDEEFDIFIAIDVTPERSLPEGTKCLMTIDHHRVETKKSKIADIRTVGSVCSIVWEYLKKEGIEFKENDEADSAIATALLVGIKTDTSDFVGENVSDLDFEAYKNLIGMVNRRQLSSIVNYPIPPYHFEIRSRLDQPENIRIDNGVFVGGVGYITHSKRDALPMMADERSRVEGIDTAFVFGIVGDHIEVSVRSVGVAVDVNALCQKIFGKQYAGGKAGAGASKIPMGFLSIKTNTPNLIQDKMWDAVKELMIDKIFHVVSGNQ